MTNRPERKPPHSPKVSDLEKRNLELVRPDTIASRDNPPSPGVRSDLLIAQEPFASIARELPPLFLKNWLESEPDGDAMTLNPDWDRMFALAAQRMLYVTTARDDGRLVGYVFTIVVPHAYAKECWQAELQAFYLDEAYRGGWAAMKMLRAAEALIREHHVIRRFYAAIPDKMQPLFKRMGYRRIETVYSKVI